MLRRTRADKVAEVYSAFMLRWPTLSDFLEAGDDELHAALRPLGLRWRVETLIALRDRLKETGTRSLGNLSHEELLALPGVGDYVASAISCFSQGEARPLIDVNSVRVIGRVFGLDTGPETRRRKSFRQLAEDLLPRDAPQAYNYALLDLAATICRPQKPACARCPLEALCAWARERRAG